MIPAYRNKGYDFTITSSTAYDHKWIRGRNIFDTIDRIVDELFENYLSRPNVRQPIPVSYTHLSYDDAIDTEKVLLLDMKT